MTSLNQLISLLKNKTSGSDLINIIIIIVNPKYLICG